MKKFGKLALAVCLSGALCFSLAGCYGPFRAARDAGRTMAGLSSGHRDDHDDHYDRDNHDDHDDDTDSKPWDALEDRIKNELSNGLSGGLTGLSDIGVAIDREENPNDHRESFSYTGQKESTLRLKVKDASNIILRQSGGDDKYQFEYDPANFRVDTTSKNGRLEISVVQLREPDRSKGIFSTPSYKCYLTIPARAYDNLEIRGDGAGLCIDGLTSSFTLDAKDAGFTIVGCTGGMTIDADDCGFAAALPKDYAGGFALSGDDSAFSLGFPDGAPENLLLRVNGQDNAIAAPKGWGQFGKKWEYKNGDGSVRVDISMSESAGSISVGE